MAPLYETTTDLTLDMYIKVYDRGPKRAYSTAVGIIGLFYILRIVSGLLKGNYFGDVFIPLIIIAFIFGLDFAGSRQLKSNYRAYEQCQSSLISYRFYDDHYETETKSTKTKASYGGILKITENDEFFCIYLSNTYFDIVEKRNCSFELEDFIRSLKK
ncbi:MAG: YcxB family protein [Clostridiales bacterium]|nr:YcxB family protein [Clostridiales bacterium]